jgi:uncharacterized protein YjbI with pentapeptide repeats
MSAHAYQLYIHLPGSWNFFAPRPHHRGEGMAAGKPTHATQHEVFATLLMQGPDAANMWRKERPAYTPEFVEANFAELPLEAVNLTNCNLLRCDLSRTDLTCAGLSNAVISESNLSFASLVDSNCHSTSFSRSNLSYASLTNANLEKASLRGATLDGANLEGTNLAETNLSGASLTRARNLTQAQIDEAFGDEVTIIPDYVSRPIHWLSFLEVVRMGAAAVVQWRSQHNIAPSLSGESLRGQDLRGMKLSGGNFAGCNFDCADLAGSDLSGSNLSGAFFAEANLKGANLSDAVIGGADFRKTVGLEQEQVEVSKGNAQTKLPEQLHIPEHWGADRWSETRGKISFNEQSDFIERHSEQAARWLFPLIRSRAIDTIAAFWDRLYGRHTAFAMRMMNSEARYSSNVSFAALDALRLLLETHFIEIVGPTRSVCAFDDIAELSEGEYGKWVIRPTDQWKNIVRVYGLGVDVLSTLSQENTHVVRPVFGGTRIKIKADVFVAMPFAAEFDGVYAAVLDAGKKTGVSIARGDDIASRRGAETIMSEVWEMIKRCELFLADCSGGNANVFYELGIAHTLGKKTAILIQADCEVPFNIRHMRYVRYRNTSSGLEELSVRLEELLRPSAEGHDR